MPNSNRKQSVLIITNMPVHHQIELFDAIHSSEEVKLEVCYLRKMSAGRLWKSSVDIKHSHFFLQEIRIRDHWYINREVNLLLSYIKDADLVVIGQYASITMQIAMYYASLIKVPWVFWSETISGVKYAAKPLLKSDGLRVLLRRIAIFPIRRWSALCWGVGDKAISSFNAALSHQSFDKFCYYSDLSPFLDLSSNDDNHEPFSFLFSGSLIFRKGFDLVIDAVNKLVTNSQENFQIHVLGSGNLQKEIPDHLHHLFCLHGFIQRDSLPRYYENKDVFLFPSRYDGWGMSLIEAMAAGIPAIASPEAGAAQEIIQNGTNGWYLETLTAFELATKMEWCLVNRDKLPHVSSQAQLSAMNYHVDVGAKRFLALVDNILA